LSRETYREIKEFREEDFLSDLPALPVNEFREEHFLPDLPDLPVNDPGPVPNPSELRG